MVQTVGRWLEEAYQNRIGFQRKEEETYRRLKSLRKEKTKGQLFCPLFLYYQLFPLDDIKKKISRNKRISLNFTRG